MNKLCRAQGPASQAGAWTGEAMATWADEYTNVLSTEGQISAFQAVWIVDDLVCMVEPGLKTVDERGPQYEGGIV